MALLVLLGSAGVASCGQTSRVDGSKSATGATSTAGAAGRETTAGGTAGGNEAGGASVAVSLGAGGSSLSSGGSPGGGSPSAGTGATSPTGSDSAGMGGAAGDPGIVVERHCTARPGVNGAGITLMAPELSAFRYAASPAGNLIKTAYDPVSRLVIVLTQTGEMYSFDPNATLPATPVATALTTTSAYDASGYVPATGYADYRGIAFGPDGTLYLLATSGATAGMQIQKGVLGNGARAWTTLVTTSAGFAKSHTNFDHNFSGMALSPDGKSLFFSSGSRTDHGEVRGDVREVPLSSAVFKVSTTTPTDLQNDAAALAPYLFADGTRNAFDMAFNADGDLIAVDNGPDMDLPDELNFLEQGKHYGFPWRFGAVDNPVLDPTYTATGDKRLHAGYQAVEPPSYFYDSLFPAPPSGVAFVDPILNLGPDANYFRANKASDPAQAGPEGLAGVSGHRSPLGIAFDTQGMLCGNYYKQGFLLSYGGVLGSSPLGDPGEDLLSIQLLKTDGVYKMTAKQLAKGLTAPIDSVLVGNRLFTIGYGSGAAWIYVFVLPTPT